MNSEQSNVDSAELAKFAHMASRWWDPEGDARPLHEMNPVRMDYITDRVALSGLRVADIGCGGGILTETLAKAGAEVIGVDMLDKSLTVARLHAAQAGLKIDYRQATAEQLAGEEPGEFDVVTCMELLEHVPDPAATVAACCVLLKPNGSAFFSTINRSPGAFVFGVVAAEYLLQLLPRGTHEYDRFVKPSELAEYGRRAGLSVCDISGVAYNPITRRARLTRSSAINYLAHFRR